MDVIYKDIDTYNIMPNWYKIGSDGSLINTKNQKAKLFISNAGYYRVNLVMKDHTHRNISIHRLVAYYFVNNPNPEIYNIVNHIDGNKLNNHYANLEWITQSENWAHANETLKSITMIGETHWKNKYPESLIIDICELLSLYPYKSNEIIKILHLVDDPNDKTTHEYFIMKKLIKNIRQRRVWKNTSNSYTWA